jgi:hypothetical protein
MPFAGWKFPDLVDSFFMVKRTCANPIVDATRYDFNRLSSIDVEIEPGDKCRAAIFENNLVTTVDCHRRWKWSREDLARQ